MQKKINRNQSKEKNILGAPPPLTPQFMGGLVPHQWFRPQDPDTVGLNPFSQLVIGYH